MKTIDTAIYEISPEIIRHRYNPLWGIILTAGSIFLLWANSAYSIFEEHEMLAQWNLLISSCLLCTGLVMICYRLFGDSSSPLEKASREKLYRSEYSCDAQYLPKIRDAVGTGDFTLLPNLPRSYHPAVQVICYRTDSGSVIAAQVLANRQPAGEIKVFRAGTYKYIE